MRSPPRAFTAFLAIVGFAAAVVEQSEMTLLLERLDHHQNLLLKLQVDFVRVKADLATVKAENAALRSVVGSGTDGSETKSFASTVTGEAEATATRRKLSSDSAASTASIMFDGGKLKISSDVEIAGNLVANGTIGSKSTPAFLAVSGDVSYMDEQNQAIPFGLTDLNVGGHYDTGTYRFTAPAKGLYLMFCGAQRNANGNSDGVRLYFAINGDIGIVGANSWGDTANHMTAINPMVLNADDYVECVNTDSGAMYGKDSDRYASFFSGVLLSAA